MLCWNIPAEAEAATIPGLSFSEAPLVTGPGDQIDPAVEGDLVIYNDLGLSDAGWIARMSLTGGFPQPVFGPGVINGPGLDSAYVAWQGPDGNACMLPAAGGVENCIALPDIAGALAFSGDKAVTSHNNKIIRLVNFGTGRSKMLDSSTTSGDRYDPDIEGTHAVWVKDRGYAGKYYEPLIVDYDLETDTYVYLTASGGGASTSGGSLYERRNPTLSSGTVLYQQRIREAGEQWDIHKAVADTYGEPVVQEPGDQVNPSLSGNLVVYQDNRSGHLDSSGEWVGEWDLYLKDLDRDIEIPLCTAPGDQVNPYISGNTVVWQDNRNGDWDIYIAVLDTVVAPELTAAVEQAYWETYADFLARELTVRYRISNIGAGAANGFTFGQVDTAPSTVTVAQAPVPVDRIAPGGSTAAQYRFFVPQGVTLFRTALFASCSDDEGREIWFPGKPPGTS